MSDKEARYKINGVGKKVRFTSVYGGELLINTDRRGVNGKYCHIFINGKGHFENPFCKFSFDREKVPISKTPNVVSISGTVCYKFKPISGHYAISSGLEIVTQEVNGNLEYYGNKLGLVEFVKIY